MSQLSDEQRRQLITAALAVRARAYAPYSNYAVGAALLAEDGRIYTGVNVENASYGLTVCAERSAIGNMISAGPRRFHALAVATANGGSPCGACRQVMAEFAGDVPVLLVDGDGQWEEISLYQLLPRHFGPEHLV